MIPTRCENEVASTFIRTGISFPHVRYLNRDLYIRFLDYLSDGGATGLCRFAFAEEKHLGVLKSHRRAGSRTRGVSVIHESDRERGQQSVTPTKIGVVRALQCIDKPVVIRVRRGSVRVSFESCMANLLFTVAHDWNFEVFRQCLGSSGGTARCSRYL